MVLLPEYPGQTPATNPALKSYRSGLPDSERMSEASCYYGLGQSAVCRMEEAVQEGETDWAKLLSAAGMSLSLSQDTAGLHGAWPPAMGLARSDSSVSRVWWLIFLAQAVPSSRKVCVAFLTLSLDDNR